MSEQRGLVSRGIWGAERHEECRACFGNEGLLPNTHGACLLSYPVVPWLTCSLLVQHDAQQHLPVRKRSRSALTSCMFRRRGNAQSVHGVVIVALPARPPPPDIWPLSPVVSPLAPHAAWARTFTPPCPPATLRTSPTPPSTRS